MQGAQSTVESNETKIDGIKDGWMNYSWKEETEERKRKRKRRKANECEAVVEWLIAVSITRDVSV